MRVYVVRHGETAYNREEISRGRKDIPLNEAGEKQAKRVGMYFICHEHPEQPFLGYKV